jgi:hypothetical protein
LPSVDCFLVVVDSEVSRLFVGAAVDAFGSGFAWWRIYALGAAVELFASTAGTLCVALFAEFPTPGASQLGLMTFCMVIVVMRLGLFGTRFGRRRL